MTSQRSWVLGAVGVLLLVGIVLLALRVTESPAHEVDEAKLEEAQASYRRSKAARDRAQPPSLPVPDKRSARARPARVQPETADDDDEPRRLERPEARRLRLSPGLPSDRGQVAPVPGAAGGGSGDGDGSLKQRMDGANKLYDRSEYEDAREAALEVLDGNPKQARMLRIVVSTSCIMGDHEVAAEYFDKLPSVRDKKQMARRCSRYGVELEE
jgi:hypothetical protein